jgi:hypothetical protein
MTRLRRLAAAVAAVALLAPGAANAQQPSLKTVLERTAEYVTAFKEQLSGLVAEESYVQDVESAPGSRPPAVSHRELMSDFLLVRMPGQARYVEFRDVFEVDGQSVRDRQDRLGKLFLNRSDAPPDFESIVEESARYNIGRVTRTVNTPTLPLLFLDPDVQSRFRFKLAAGGAPVMANGSGRSTTTSTAHFTVSTEVWVVEYQEVERGTVIRTPNGKDMPARGRFWIEPATGRVLMSELIAEDANVLATIDVSYQSEPVVGLLVPIEMRERYDVRGDGSRITGAATYSKFRQFRVHVDENILPPDPPSSTPVKP